ncbi:phage tail tape measure protein [Burkholderia ubonensis]|uniref:phage tail tape measure protein n=1 Tax=Burkholderia ubonensis TaxID=101571 RepID=UPI000754AF5D|nr:phage tail tape measure protein [Burkholderia ubonensis]KWC40821.1 phage tail tape measure protein [Burkholderia ubonensis]
MGRTFEIGVRIVANAASMISSIGSARRTLASMGDTMTLLRARQNELGSTIQRNMGTLAPSTLAALNRDYLRLGRTIDLVQSRHAALAARLARGVALREQRQALGSEMIGTFATAAATAAPLLNAVKHAANFEAGLRDIAITGNLTRAAELKVGQEIRKAALATSQGHDAILLGVGTLVAAGMDAQEASQKSNLLGRVATATNADMKDLAGMVYSFSETLGIKGDAGLKEAFNRAAYGGKLGRFELKDMAKALPALTEAFAFKGIKGQDALTQIIASLEVGREGAGSGDEAVTNLTNWLSHMNSQSTITAYQKAGVDYQKSMSNLVAAGYSSYEGSLQIAQQFIASRGDAFMKQWKSAGAKGDEEAQRKLMESFGLNEVFQDIQTINHLLAMRQGWDKYQKNKQAMGSKQALNTIDQDYVNRADLSTMAWRRFQTQIVDTSITVGDALKPALTDLLNSLTPMIKGVGQFAAEHPGAIRAVVGFMGSIVALKGATLAAGWGLNFFIKSPLNMVGTAFATVRARWALLQALWIGGGSRLSTVFQIFGMGADRAGKLAAGIGRAGAMFMRFGRGVLVAGRVLLPFGQGILMTVLGPLRLLAQGGLLLGRVLGGNLVRGLMLAGRAILWLGRAIMLNPIGLAITAIAVGAYLIYRYWTPIKQFFIGIWNTIREAFAGGIGGVMRLIVNWSPLGLFYRAFASVMKWFGVSLPQTFTGFGGMIIDGLVNGIRSRFTAAKNTLQEFGGNVKAWFANTLGIKSPSRVFMGYGDNITAGAAIGIARGTAQVRKAAATMAQSTADAAKVRPMIDHGPQAAIVAASRASVPVRANSNAQGSGGGGMTVHLNQTFNIDGGGKDVKAQIQETTRITLREFETMMDRYMQGRARRAY